jgi:hypothetical protein
MSGETGKSSSGGAVRGLIAAVLLAAAIAGCMNMRDIFAPSAPVVGEEWTALLAEIREFERRIGFEETKNFRSLATGEQESFRFCGHASPYRLPYSYEDPAIQWLDSITEQECREIAEGHDVYYGAVEALGEVGTPVTPAMVTGKLDNFLYLVIHEDCHDQFDLPYGVEEALCNLITYRAMEMFAREKFKWYAGEQRAVRRYAERQSSATRATIQHYGQLEALYARFERGEIGPEALLRERAAILKKAERQLGWKPGEMNNVVMANDMTYSRHYPFLESVHAALGNDLARTVAFFKHVDRLKPSRAAVMKQHRIQDERSVEFIRAYEEAVVETARKALAEKTGPAFLR